MLAYANSLEGVFVLDDPSTVTENATIRNLSSWRVLQPPGDGAPVQGRPLTNLSLAINYAFGGTRPQAYHAGNVALHAINALLLFALVRRTLRLLGQEGTTTALVIAVLWAVHPLTTAAVDYVSQRSELLASSFYLMTLYCVARSNIVRLIPSPGTPGEGKGGGLQWQALAVMACLLGVLSKETLVTAPIMALLYDVTFLAGSWKQWWRGGRRWMYVGLFATWAALAWLMIHSGSRGDSVGFGGDVTAWQYALTQCRALALYLKLTFWPHPMVFDYGPFVVRRFSQVWPEAVLVAVLLIAAIMLWCWRPKWGFIALAWFILLAPTSSFVPVWTQTIAEHRAYLPLAAIVVLLVLGVREAFFAATRRSHGVRVALGSTSVALAIVLIAVTRQRNAEYDSALVLWEDAIQHWPFNPRAYTACGNAYAAAGQHGRAIDAFTQSIRLRPANGTAYVNRGTAWLALGSARRAVDDYDEAINLLRGENAAEAYFNRGDAWLSLGDLRRAAADYRQALRLKPSNSAAYHNLGGVHWMLGEPDQALLAYDRAIALEPTNAEFHRNRGVIRDALGRHREAIADDDEAIRLNPRNPTTYFDRAAAYGALHEHDRAWADVKTGRQMGGTPPPALLRSLIESSGRSE